MQTVGDKDDKVTIMTITDTTTGAMIATTGPKKGHDPFVEKVVKYGIESFGRNCDFVLQGDGEYGSLDVVRRVAQRARRARRFGIPRLEAVHQNALWSGVIRTSKA